MDLEIALKTFEWPLFDMPHDPVEIEGRAVKENSGTTFLTAAGAYINQGNRQKAIECVLKGAELRPNEFRPDDPNQWGVEELKVIAQNPGLAYDIIRGVVETRELAARRSPFYSDIFEMIRKDEDTVHVYQDDFKDGSVRLLSEGFGRCQGIAFLDKGKRKGALAHISSATHPNDLVNGRTYHVTGQLQPPVKKLKDMFDDVSEVRAINVYPNSRYSWSPDTIDKELASVGISEVIHVPLTTYPDPSAVYHRAIAVDVQKGVLYIFPHGSTRLITIPFFSSE